MKNTHGRQTSNTLSESVSEKQTTLTVMNFCFAAVSMHSALCPLFVPQWGTEDAEIKVASVEYPELTNVLLETAMHASPTARNFATVAFSTFPVRSPSLFQNPLSTF